MKRALVLVAVFGGTFACERVCGELEPLLSITGGAGTGGAGTGGAGTGGAGQSMGGNATSTPAGGGMAGATSMPGGSGGVPTGCESGGAGPTGHLLISDFEPNSTAGIGGPMESDPGQPNLQPDSGRYSEQGSFTNAGLGFQYPLGCVDASGYEGVQFEYSGSPDNSWMLAFSVVTPEGATELRTFQPGDGALVLCLPFEQNDAGTWDRSGVTALRWTYLNLTTFEVSVQVSIDNVAFYPAGSTCAPLTGGTGGTGGTAGSG